ncbi:hypothetical protein OP10G_1637 [Fimbriimonas ginsengisoli Gsoil 348]|uniref:Uncharacterized protein n=2 Tax=Fimbriimonas ginsengisoli TaxID=1005039 RepID=A0A068NQI8_FIMGI|nr:hypothetical protein OP10G_1637 [Fimbriimonas ginsengisoli Gsoil 348]
MFSDRVSTSIRGGLYILPGDLVLTLNPQSDGVHAIIKRGRQPVLGTILGGKVQGIPFRLYPNADTVLEGSIYLS